MYSEYFFLSFCIFSFNIQQAWSVTCKRWNVIYEVKKLFRRTQENDHSVMISKDHVHYQELQKNTYQLFFQKYNNYIFEIIYYYFIKGIT